MPNLGQAMHVPAPAHSITLTVNDRPHYLQRMLAALADVRGVHQWHLFVALEPGNDECAALCEAIAFMPRTIIYNSERLGIRGNPFHVLQTAFAQGSTLNIYLEDDLIVSPDLCELALWYQQQVPELTLHDVRIFFMNLFTTSTTDDRADEVVISKFFSPWGMIINRQQWLQYMAPCWWNDDHRYPHRQDWTLSLAEALNRDRRLVVLTPRLSRTANTGREGGVHSRPERHDLLVRGLVMNRRPHAIPYRINRDGNLHWRKLDYDTMTVSDEEPAETIAASA
jgi:hypothetical protein